MIQIARILIACGVLLSSFFMMSSVHSANVEMKWTDPDKYRDIRSARESRKHFQQRIFSDFEKYFAELAERLPEGQRLKIEVTDVDLAGEIRFVGSDEIRIITDNYYPRLQFAYQLLNADNHVVISGQENLKDMSFMTGSHLKYQHKSFGHEKRMLDKWFANVFKKNLE